MTGRIRRLIRVAGFAIFVAAVAQEMGKPEAERTGQGKVGGVVPYDFRPPTWDRLREAYWNPDDDRLFSDRPFGVGWAVNLYRARALMTDAYQSLMGGTLPASARWRQRTARVKGKAAQS